jgi:hypothetical protein
MHEHNSLVLILLLPFDRDDGEDGESQHSRTYSEYRGVGWIPSKIVLFASQIRGSVTLMQTISSIYA